jgi:hypothetical protein
LPDPPLLGLLAVMWVVEILDFILLFARLDGFGIRPRSQSG